MIKCNIFYYIINYIYILYIYISSKTHLTWFYQLEEKFLMERVNTLWVDGALRLNFISGYRVLIKHNDDTDTITGNNYPFYPFMVHFI